MLVFSHWQGALIEQISESSESVAWRVQVGDAELVGFVADDDRARVVTGPESTWAEFGADAWAL
ncbi:MAG TPA: hypothetical protein VES40_19845 [Ilumatobacteraceae bacterium]|nr:hypothetical protein [Ilumatobacteraceae bacterium]